MQPIDCIAMAMVHETDTVSQQMVAFCVQRPVPLGFSVSITLLARAKKHEKLWENDEY